MNVPVLRGVPAGVPGGGGLAEVAGPVLALVAFGVLFAVLAAAKFRFDEPKAYYG